jgi:hypothetical protein
MRLTNHRGALSALLIGAAVACVDLDVTNPNQQTSGTFWRTEADAVAGVTATYNGLLHNGGYGRWIVFVTDLRSDIGQVVSPWTDLSNFSKFTFVDKDFEVNREFFQHHYQAIFRANQAIDRIPGIGMDAGLRSRLVAEAKFIRALMYYDLVNLYENIPLVIGEPAPEDRPATATPAATWAAIEADLTAARAVLPEGYTGGDVGRATKWAATALLAKAHMQQREWALAEPLLREIITSNDFDLMANYGDNFTDAFENNIESIFEVQFGGPGLLSAGIRGLNIAKMAGPCGPSFCDGRPTQWYFDQFMLSRTTTNGDDPRLDKTIFYEHPGEDVYGLPFVNPADRRPAGSIFFKKWGEYYIKNGDQNWDAAINFRVIRFADILLLQAEALNELTQTGAAYTHINRVRTRANLPNLTAGLSQDAFRDAVLRERMFELGFEAQRWNDLRRHNMINKTLLEPRDPEFQFFTPNKSELLPIPQSEVDLNPAIKQNPGWG